MKAFVTGSTGFLGRRLVSDLLAHGYEVTALVRTFDRARLLPAQVCKVSGDVTRRASMKAAMAGADVVFHTAAWRQIGVRPRDYERMARINVDGARETLELAADLGVPRIIHTSELEVAAAGPPLQAGSPGDVRLASAYARSKRRAHFEVAAALQARGLPVIIVCPGVLYGPGHSLPWSGLLQRYARQRLPIMIGPGSIYHWLYIDDAAAGHRLAAERGQPGLTYSLPGLALSLRQFFAAAERATGRPAPRLWLPDRLAAGLARLLRRPTPALAERLAVYAGAPGLASAAQLAPVPGWTSRPIEDGLSEAVAWHQREMQSASSA